MSTIINRINNTFDALYNGRGYQFSPSMKEFLRKHGNKTIVRLQIQRAPILSVFQKTLNLLSWYEQPYDIYPVTAYTVLYDT